MDANKKILLIITAFFWFTNLFSQKKEDVYFLLEDNHNSYTTSYITYGEKKAIIILSNRKEYEYHQKKVKEAKDNGTYYFDPESGRDNLDIYVSNLTFKILKKEKISINNCAFRKLKTVNYSWLLNEGWKQLNGRNNVTEKPSSFKNIYFLREINKNTYISYKVRVIVIDY